MEFVQMISLYMKQWQIKRNKDVHISMKKNNIQ